MASDGGESPVPYDISHGVIMGVAVVLVLPLASIYMRIGGSVWIHGAIQIFGIFLLLAGLGTGVKLAQITDQVVLPFHFLGSMVSDKKLIMSGSALHWWFSGLRPHCSRHNHHSPLPYTTFPWPLAPSTISQDELQGADIMDAHLVWPCTDGVGRGEWWPRIAVGSQYNQGRDRLWSPCWCYWAGLHLLSCGEEEGRQKSDYEE